jgi:hypothetical protein
MNSHQCLSAASALITDGKRADNAAFIVEACNFHASLKAEVERPRAAAKELLEASYAPLASKESMQRLYDARAEALSPVSESM